MREHNYYRTKRAAGYGTMRERKKIIGLDSNGSVLYNSFDNWDARAQAMYLSGPTTKGIVMGRRRPSVIRRVRVNDPREQMDELSDGEGMARYLLRKGYRAAHEIATIQYKRATDKKVRQLWNNARVWIGILSDRGAHSLSFTPRPDGMPDESA